MKSALTRSKWFLALGIVVLMILAGVAGVAVANHQNAKAHFNLCCINEPTTAYP
jgi:hypothetical protein